VAAYEARSATAVVLEVGSGRVLAAASWPSYDPNAWRTSDPAAMRNRPLVQQYEPGSVMKPFLVAGLLESGRLDAREADRSAGMTLRVGRKTFRDVAQHDPSCQRGGRAALLEQHRHDRLAQRFESAELHAWLAAFGFGQEMALRSAFAARGSLTDPAAGCRRTTRRSRSARASPRRTCSWPPPTRCWRRTVSTSPRDWSRTSGSRPTYRVLSPETALAVRHMLAAHGRGGQPPVERRAGVATAGKTGTADVYDADAAELRGREVRGVVRGHVPGRTPRGRHGGDGARAGDC
jgi:cell division protein FtsI (penicillin-binding protein 3)